MDIIVLLANIKHFINKEIRDYLNGSYNIEYFNSEDIDGFSIEDIIIDTRGTSIIFKNGDVQGSIRGGI